MKTLNSFLACTFAFLALTLATPAFGQSSIDAADQYAAQLLDITFQMEAVLNKCDVASEVCVADAAEISGLYGALAGTADNLRNSIQSSGIQSLNRDANQLHAKVNSLNGKLSRLANANPGSAQFNAAMGQVTNSLNQVIDGGGGIRVEIQSIRNGN